MITPSNSSLPTVQYQELSWDPIATSWPTKPATGHYSFYSQVQPQEGSRLERAKPVLPDSRVLGLSPLWDQTSHSDSWEYLLPQTQNNDSAGYFEKNYHEVSTGQSVNSEKQLHSTEIFSHGWPDQAADTVCGWGSSEQHTRLIRNKFVDILNTYQVKTLNDAGCGDLAWMSMIDLEGIDYVGYDIYERVNWADLQERGYQLEVLDITSTELRPADLLICRDVFIHLPNDMVLPTLERFRRSASLLLTTSYTSDWSMSERGFSNFERMNEPSLHHKKLDLSLPPFNLGQPLVKIPENSPNKYLGLWDMKHPPAGT